MWNRFTAINVMSENLYEMNAMGYYFRVINHLYLWLLYFSLYSSEFREFNQFLKVLADDAATAHIEHAQSPQRLSRTDIRLNSLAQSFFRMHRIIVIRIHRP